MEENSKPHTYQDGPFEVRSGVDYPWWRLVGEYILAWTALMVGAFALAVVLWLLV